MPSGLAGPIDVALARAGDSLPGPAGMPGGSSYLLKFDGFRLVITRRAAGVRLWSRRGAELTRTFPEIAAAARHQIPLGSVDDGEVCCSNGSRLDFDLLIQRLSAGRVRLAQLREERPASFVAFDLLAAGGVDLRRRPWRTHQKVLNELAPWQPPLQLCPSTTDPDEAQTWMDRYAAAGPGGATVPLHCG
jgi:ATP-dependent DNA ligase